MESPTCSPKALLVVLGLTAFVLYRDVHSPLHATTLLRVPARDQPHCSYQPPPPPKTLITDDSEPTPACRTEDNNHSSIVFAKVRKTAGSTLGSIIARYGYTRNSTFALPKHTNSRFGNTPFEARMLQTQPDDNGFDFLITHVPFNKSSMRKVMNMNAKYITVLRDPLSHFYSSVEYFELQESLQFFGDINSPEFCLEDFLSAVRKCNKQVCQGTYNGQMFDLGRFTKDTATTQDQLEYKIKQVLGDFDLVLIQDYFDESLILLKELMCWGFKDILYLSKKLYHGRYSPSAQHADLIRDWNSEDSALYNYFNTTLWAKIKKYGPSFEKDLTKFRAMNRDITEQCEHLARHSGLGRDQLSAYCHNLQIDVNDWVRTMREIVAEAYELGPDEGRIVHQWGPRKQD